MVHFLQAVINFVMALHWSTILAFLSSNAVVVVVAQLIKKYTKLEKDGVIKFMVASLSTLNTTVLLIMADPAALSMLGIYAPASYGFTQAIYPVVRYAWNWIEKVNANLNAPKTPSDASQSTSTGQPSEATF